MMLAPKTRREMLKQLGAGMGTIGLAGLMADKGLLAPAAQASTSPLAPKTPHFAPKAKHIIQLFMPGGPSQGATFDHKPALTEPAGNRPSRVDRKTLRNTKNGLMPSPFGFKQYGQSGKWVSDIFPEVGKMVDDICFVHSMHTDIPEHAGAIMMMNVGHIQPNRPSLGSWLAYGLGSESDNLPGFVAMSPRAQPRGKLANWGSSFLPGAYAGSYVNIGSMKPDAVIADLKNGSLNRSEQRKQADLLAKLNRGFLARREKDAQIEAGIEAMEMAFRMQASVPELMNISDEPKHILDMYGTKGGDGSYAGNCLLARRLAERGVRFIQLYHRGWDHHGGIKKGIEHTAGLVDKATAALVTDLRQRGMLDDTLIVYGGEFGRTPMAQGNGRDHHINAFSMWLAGAGIKGGVTHGATDDLGYNAVKDVVHVHDLHATMLHLLGIPHKQLTYRFQGRDFRLTDVHGNLVKPILT